MPAPLSPDLRRRIADAHARGGASMPALARRFDVSAITVRRLVKRRRDGGALAPTVRATPLSRRLVRPEHEAHVEAWIAAEPSVPQHVLAARLSALVGRAVSQQTAGAALRRMGFTYKKNGYARPSN